MAKPSIEAYGDAPLAFRLANPGLTATYVDGDSLSLCTAVRAFSGMQKEALVASSKSDSIWRMVCDEGPYLNGSDLAPPPLAYFSAGMASSLADAIESRHSNRGDQFHSLEIVQDNRYTMEGSALRGTMRGGALPVDIKAERDSATSSDNVAAAISQSPIETLMRKRLSNTFSVTHNGIPIAPGKVAKSATEIPANAMPLFDDLGKPGESADRIDVVTKLDSAESVFEDDHGAGAAMKEQQKRELHIRSVLTSRPDGLRDIRVQIFKPVGSIFAFVCEPIHGTGRAPNGLELVSAGIAFCFMTQIGRYSGIAKKEIRQYSVVQDTMFGSGNNRCGPVTTHVFIDSPEPTKSVQEIVAMAEQTCFLHAACRESNESQISI